MNIFLKRPAASLLVCALFVAAPAAALDPNRALSQYVHDRWDSGSGFPGGSVYAITQTTDGYLWAATGAGLVRFDGLHFELIQDHSGDFGFTSVLGLAADADGSLWIRLRDTSLIRYRNGQFENPFRDPAPVSNVTAMARTNAHGLLAARMQLGAFTFAGGALQPVALASGLPRSPVIAVAQAANGDTWIGTRGSGLYRLAGGKTIPVTQGLPDPKVNFLLPEAGGNLWVGTDSGVAFWNGSRLTTQGLPAPLLTSQILSLIKDRDGNLWVGTDSQGLLRYNTRGAAPLDILPHDRDNAVTALFEDREGSLWIGRGNGLERLRDSAFVTYSRLEGVPTEGNSPIFVDEDRRTWFAPPEGGLWWLKGNAHGHVSIDGLDRDVVYSIAGSGHDLWLGRQRGGLTRLTTGPGGIRATSFTGGRGFARNSVYSVYVDRAGAVWAGTLSAGVDKWDGAAFSTFDRKDGLASNTVASILQTASGAMWFATPAGISTWYNGTWRTYTTADGLPSSNVNCLLQDSAGVLWAGTTAGLAYFSSGRFHAPTPSSALLQDQVLGIAEGNYGSLWVSTAYHVLRINRAKLLQGILTPTDVREFVVADGLRGVEGVKRHRSVLADPDGRIWMSLLGGVSVVDPVRLTRAAAPALPHVQELTANGNAIGLEGKVSVPPGRQRIVFGYSGLNLSNPGRVRFRFWLEGYDRGWSEPASEPEAVYTNLSPGPYRFRLIASNPDGDWSQSEGDLAFRVEPSYWQTWWFRAGMVLSCFLAALALYRLRLRQVTERLNVRFQERLAERTRIAQELHDTLLQGFISASMQVDVAVHRLPEESPVRASLLRAVQLMRQVIEEGRNAVRGLRSTAGGSFELEEAFSRLPEEFATSPGAAEVEYQVVVEGRRRPLHPVLRDEVYRIGREAITNSFRHAKASKLEVELNYGSGLFRLVVRDDGCGIDPGTLSAGRDGHWGLSGMRERADRIGARLRVLSSSAGGTEIDLAVPGHIAYKNESSKSGKRTRKELAKLLEKAP